MRIYNRYIMTVVTLLLVTTVIMVACKVTSLENYYSVYVLETLVATEVYGYCGFSIRARRGLHTVSVVLFLGFIGVLVIRVVKMINLV